jgi:SNW domain-containing protein 1
VDKFLSEVDQNSSSKRGYGLQDEERQSKRPRVEEDDEDD